MFPDEVSSLFLRLVAKLLYEPLKRPVLEEPDCTGCLEGMQGTHWGTIANGVWRVNGRTGTFSIGSMGPIGCIVLVHTGARHRAAAAGPRASARRRAEGQFPDAVALVDVLW